MLFPGKYQGTVYNKLKKCLDFILFRAQHDTDLFCYSQ